MFDKRDTSIPEWQVELAILNNLSILNHPIIPMNFDSKYESVFK